MSETVTIASWTTSPYTSYDKRGVVIHHRVRIVRYDRTTADVVHERREGNDDWTTVGAVELREHGLTKQKLRDGVLEE